MLFSECFALFKNKDFAFLRLCVKKISDMKVGIIGAGNMGGAIARGLAQGHYVREQDIIVTNPSMPKLDALKAEYPAIQVSTNCRCGDCSGEALENGRSIEAFALAPASDIGIGCCGIDIRELGTLR